jgi:serine protease inhibitor
MDAGDVRRAGGLPGGAGPGGLPGGLEDTAVAAINGLTARWAGSAAGAAGGTAFSAVGLWPLLAFLGTAAHGPARAELAEALGMSPDIAALRARTLLDTLDAARGVSAVTGVWTSAALNLREDWLAGLPAGVSGRLTGDPAADRAALDAWAADGTRGLIPAFPLALDPRACVVLASALTVETAWRQPFEPALAVPAAGPWTGRRDLAALTRTGTDLDQVRVAATPRGPLTVLEVRGDNGIDVHLLLGEVGARPATVLRAGIDVLAGTYPQLPGSALPLGTRAPGVTVELVPSWSPDALLHTTTFAFTVRADHDLLARPELFGLAAATDRRTGHFPGISDVPLAVGQAGQTMTASFSADGFVAAAVTAVSMMVGAALPPARAKHVSVDFDRPVGFLAVHRPTGLVLTAGWVTEPETAKPGW